MANTVKIPLTDRLDRTYELEAPHGQAMRKFLLEKYIPSGSILLKVNGLISDDQT